MYNVRRVLLTRVTYQESKLLVSVAASVCSVSEPRQRPIAATTDAHHRPVRVHAQRPGKGLQAIKQSKSARPPRELVWPSGKALGW